MSIFSSSYRFAEKASERSWRLWSSVYRELYHAASLIAFDVLDTRRAICPEVLAIDASGAEVGDHGDHGVMQRTWPEDRIWSLGGKSEKWRYHAVGAIAARRHALDIAKADERRGHPVQAGVVFDEVSICVR